MEEAINKIGKLILEYVDLVRNSYIIPQIQNLYYQNIQDLGDSTYSVSILIYPDILPSDFVTTLVKYNLSDMTKRYITNHFNTLNNIGLIDIQIGADINQLQLIITFKLLEYISSIPKEILREILLNNEYEDIKKLCGTNIEYSKICEEKSFWISKIKHDFPKRTLDLNIENMEQHYLHNRLLNTRYLHNILLNNTYDDIKKLCETNIAYSKICEDELFWISKIKHDFPEWRIDLTINNMENHYLQLLKSSSVVRKNHSLVIDRTGNVWPFGEG